MLSIDLKGKKAFIAGIGDDAGFGWAIAKELAEAGAEIIVGTWPPVLKIFTMSFEGGKFDESRKLSNGQMMNFSKIYALDASFDKPEDVPQEVKENKRYAGCEGYTISEVAEKVKKDFGNIDILVHSLANAPEVKSPLLETTRKGYLAAMSASSYSLVSLISHFGPIMKKEGSCISLTYTASTKAIPGYGGGMSSAKAALESDTRSLAYEAGRKFQIRVNTISAGPLKSRAAKAIGMIDYMIAYSEANSPITSTLKAEEVANAAVFLASPLSSAITGSVLFVDKGLNVMGLAMDSKSLENYPTH